MPNIYKEMKSTCKKGRDGCLEARFLKSRSRNPKSRLGLCLGPRRLEFNSRHCSDMGIGVPAEKNLGGNGVLPKFCDVCRRKFV